jgi:hypothetical protein
MIPEGSASRANTGPGGKSNSNSITTLVAAMETLTLRNLDEAFIDVSFLDSISLFVALGPVTAQSYSSRTAPKGHPRSPLPVRRENVVFSLYDRMARVPAIDDAGLVGRERVGL